MNRGVSLPCLTEQTLSHLVFVRSSCPIYASVFQVAVSSFYVVLPNFVMYLLVLSFYITSLSYPIHLIIISDTNTSMGLLILYYSYIVLVRFSFVEVLCTADC